MAAVARSECTHSPFTCALTPRLKTVFLNDVAVDRGRIERAIKLACAVISHWTKHEAGEVLAMAGERQIFLN